MLNSLLKKLVRKASGRTKFIMAIIGLSVALLLILSAVQLQINYNDLLHSKTNQDSLTNFLVINKRLNNDNANKATLSNEEIAQLKQQPFIDDIGILSPSRFKASIQTVSDRFPFYSDMAFESVPSALLM